MAVSALACNCARLLDVCAAVKVEQAEAHLGPGPFPHGAICACASGMTRVEVVLKKNLSPRLAAPPYWRGLASWDALACSGASRPTGREPLFGNLARPGTRPVQRRCGAREWRAGPIEPIKQRDGHTGSRSPAPIALAKTPGASAAGPLLLASRRQTEDGRCRRPCASFFTARRTGWAGRLPRQGRGRSCRHRGGETCARRLPVESATPPG